MNDEEDGRRGAEARRRSAERIQRVKPWLKSTGPRTAEGKARSGARSTKHGRYSAEAKAEAKSTRALLRAMRRARNTLE